MAAGDEAEDLAVMGDREDRAVAEAVDQVAGGGLLGDAGEDHLAVGDSQSAEVADEGGPAVGGVAGSVAGIACDVGVEPVDEVVVCPGVGEAGLVELGGQFVDVGEAFRGGAGFVPGVAAAEQVVDLGLSEFGLAFLGAGHGFDLQDRPGVVDDLDLVFGDVRVRGRRFLRLGRPEVVDRLFVDGVGEHGGPPHEGLAFVGVFGGDRCEQVRQGPAAGSRVVEGCDECWPPTHPALSRRTQSVC